MCYREYMKPYIHARLNKEDQAVLTKLRKSTGHSESELIRRGLRLMLKEAALKQSALDLAGSSVGKFKGAPRDLSTNKKHLAEFGE